MDEEKYLPQVKKTITKKRRKKRRRAPVQSADRHTLKRINRNESVVEGTSEPAQSADRHTSTKQCQSCTVSKGAGERSSLRTATQAQLSFQCFNDATQGLVNEKRLEYNRVSTGEPVQSADRHTSTIKICLGNNV